MIAIPLEEFRRTFLFLKMKRKGFDEPIILKIMMEKGVDGKQVNELQKLFPNIENFRKHKLLIVSTDCLAIVCTITFLISNFYFNGIFLNFIASLPCVPLLGIIILYFGTGSKMQHYYSLILSLIQIVLTGTGFTDMPTYLRIFIILAATCVLVLNRRIEKLNFTNPI
jgi:ABC-type proline/glycine betaine transport system permease subunit